MTLREPWGQRFHPGPSEKSNGQAVTCGQLKNTDIRGLQEARTKKRRAGSPQLQPWFSNLTYGVVRRCLSFTISSWDS